MHFRHVELGSHFLPGIYAFVTIRDRLTFKFASGNICRDRLRFASGYVYAFQTCRARLTCVSGNVCIADMYNRDRLTFVSGNTCMSDM